MNIRSSFALRRWVGVALLLCVALVASACTSTPIDPTWAGISLVGDGQNILIAFENQMTLINPTTGRPVELRDAEGQVRVDDQGNARVWNIPSPDGGTKFYTSPLPLDEGSMLALAYTKKLYRVDLASGVLYNATTGVDLPGQVIAAPTINGDLMYVGFSERNLIAYDISDVQNNSITEVWRLETDHGIWASPLLVEGVLYVPCMNHTLYALNAETGELLWSADLQGAITSTPVFQNGRLYVGTLARKVFEISASDGQILSESATQDWVWGTPALVENTLYVADMAGYVYAFGIGDGGLTQQWSQQVATKGIRATPVVVGDALIVASRDTYVYWLNPADGSPLLDTEGSPIKRQVNGEVLADMLVINPSEGLDIPEPLLIVSTMNRAELLVAFALDTGQRQWVYGR